MIADLNFSLILVITSCAKGASCPWWTSDVGPSPLFTCGVFLGLFGLVFLANFLRRHE